MIAYRCVFTFSRGSVTLGVLADDPALAVEMAREIVPHYDAISVELFDAVGSVMRVDRHHRSMSGGVDISDVALSGGPLAG